MVYRAHLNFNLNFEQLQVGANTIYLINYIEYNNKSKKYFRCTYH